MGIVMGTVEVVLHVVILKGRERRDEGMIKGYTQAPSLVTNYAAQIGVEEGVSDDRRFLEKCAIPIAEVLPMGFRTICRENSTMVDR